MSKIRINELARQLEVKSREVIDKLHELGIAEKSLTPARSTKIKPINCAVITGANHTRPYPSLTPMAPVPLSRLTAMRR